MSDDEWLFDLTFQADFKKFRSAKAQKLMIPAAFSNPPPPLNLDPDARACVVPIFEGTTVQALYEAGLRAFRAVDGKGPPMRLSRASDSVVTEQNMSTFIFICRPSCTTRFEQEDLSWSLIPCHSYLCTQVEHDQVSKLWSCRPGTPGSPKISCASFAGGKGRLHYWRGTLWSSLLITFIRFL